MCVTRKPLPPYGKIIEAYQQEKIKLKYYITIYIGKDAKDEAYLSKCHGSLCMYLPYIDNIDKYHWPINDQLIILYHTGGIDVDLAISIALYLIEKHDPVVMWFQYNTFEQEYAIVDEHHSSPNFMYSKASKN